MGYRFRRSVCIATAFIVAIPWTAARADKATTVVVNGFGQDQCGQYVEAYRRGRNGYAPYISFVQGYASAMSQRAALVEGRTIDFTNGASIEGMALWLANYCTQHPLQVFGSATQQFLEAASGVAPK